MKDYVMNNYMSRCSGDWSNYCSNCDRKLQLEKDDPSKWYPFMTASPINDVCIYRIPVYKDEK